jgi:hypothetical protein
MVVKPYNEREPWDVFAIDGQGRPTTYLSYMILKTAFYERKQWFTPKDLAKLLVAKYADTDMVCRQLELADLLTENSQQRGQYRYNMESTNVDVQAGFEKFLIDVELEVLPVHLMLDYSPSIRSCGYFQRSPAEQEQE